MNALRRIAALARATARDLFAGHGAALLGIALLAAVDATRATLGRSEGGLRAVARERTAGAAVVAARSRDPAARRPTTLRARADSRSSPPRRCALSTWALARTAAARPAAGRSARALAAGRGLRRPEQFAPGDTTDATRVV
jgi:hypothetical protein